ncbi:MAG: MoxR family ATPase [Polyangia bacterium]
MPAFSSIDDVHARLSGLGYIADKRIATTLFLADHMERPILVEGPAGVGKTELAKALATTTNAPLFRLQCYEGLDEGKALYEWAYPKQLLYTQILRDKVGEVLSGTDTLAAAVDRLASQEDAFFSERFLLARPLLAAIRSPQRAVLLIDEVDRADPEFEAFLLEVLSDFQVSVPELGTLKAAHIPFVILTSNNAREMTDALKRRCLHLFVDYPSKERELEIVRSRVPEASAALAEQLVGVVARVRALDLKKSPSVSETLDWARALVLLGRDTLDAATVTDTLSLILKYEGDIQRATEQLASLVG